MSLCITHHRTLNSTIPSQSGLYKDVLFIYAPNANYQGNLITQIFPGFRPLGHSKDEAKNLALSLGITQAAFPEYPANTGFNFYFVMAISAIIANTKTFKNTDMVFSTLSEDGSIAQTLISRPTPTANQSVLRCDTTPTGLYFESL